MRAWMAWAPAVKALHEARRLVVHQAPWHSDRAIALLHALENACRVPDWRLPLGVARPARHWWSPVERQPRRCCCPCSHPSHVPQAVGSLVGAAAAAGAWLRPTQWARPQHPWTAPRAPLSGLRCPSLCCWSRCHAPLVRRWTPCRRSCALCCHHGSAADADARAGALC